MKSRSSQLGMRSHIRYFFLFQVTARVGPVDQRLLPLHLPSLGLPLVKSRQLEKRKDRLRDALDPFCLQEAPRRQRERALFFPTTFLLLRTLLQTFRRWNRGNVRQLLELTECCPQWSSAYQAHQSCRASRRVLRERLGSPKSYSATFSPTTSNRRHHPLR
jgi:hypothetical protein